MTQRQKALLSCAVAAASLLSGCRKGNNNSGGHEQFERHVRLVRQCQHHPDRRLEETGLGILTEASTGRTGTIHTIAAAVLLDGRAKLADVMLDELEVEIAADGKVSSPCPPTTAPSAERGRPPLFQRRCRCQQVVVPFLALGAVVGGHGDDAAPSTSSSSATLRRTAAAGVDAGNSNRRCNAPDNVAFGHAHLCRYLCGSRTATGACCGSSGKAFCL